MAKKFQSTHLHEVWRSFRTTLKADVMFQSTHLHEVWLPCAGWRDVLRFVSIHTPTWGVTLQGLPRAPIGRVSIHTPTWGVTIGATPAFQFGVFQSTHLHEVWHDPFIMITKGHLFQSTHLHEVWLIVRFIQVCINRFQSTHLHEVWP